MKVRIEARTNKRCELMILSKRQWQIILSAICVVCKTQWDDKIVLDKSECPECKSKTHYNMVSELETVTQER